MGNYLSGSETRHRLLDAAAEIFAEHGYRHAKVGAICQRAKANVAAVNYHFGGKGPLYLEVIQHATERANADLPLKAAETPGTPEQRLRRFIHSFMSSILLPKKPDWVGQLMAHEMIEPTQALDLMVDRVVSPLNQALHRIVAEILNDDPDSELVTRCSASVIGQCVVYHNSEAIVKRLSGLTYTRDTVEALAEHVTRFSLEALHALARPKAKGGSGKVKASSA